MKGRLSTLGILLALSTVIISGCGSSPAQPPTPTAVVVEPSATPIDEGELINPTEPPAPAEGTVQAPDATRARDLALSFVAGRYGDRAPAYGLAWGEEDITPEGLVGSSTLQYTSGDWVVSVSYPIVAPQNTVYQVTVSNRATRFEWQGEVDAEGQVTEQVIPTRGVPAVGWMGNVVSLPAGSQYDDYLALLPEGAGEIGVEGADEAVEAEIVALRDKDEPGKYAHFWGTLLCDVPDYGGCQLVVTQVRSGPTYTEPEPVEAWEGFIVSNPPMSQFDDYFVLAGDFPVAYGIDSIDPAVAAQLESLRDTGITARVWGQLRTGVPDAFGSQIEVTRVEDVGDPLAPAPTADEQTTQPVVEPLSEGIADWAGVIVSNPPGAQFDDYFEWQSFEGGSYGIDSLDEGIRQQIVALRDTGTTVRIWGTLYYEVPDVNATQIQVTRIEMQEPPEPPEISEQAVEGWVGRIHKLPPGNQHGQTFERQDGERFGIGATDEATWEQLRQVVWTGAQIEVWGTLYLGVPATEARQIQVEHLEILTGPAEDARDLTPFAISSASSHLPTDHGGQYQSFMAMDSALDTAWAEGVSGSGVGEWLELQFPGTVEVHSIALDVGYDQDQDIFSANNRIKRATFIFSSGEQVTLDFSDSRGLQTIPLVRAPGPNINTTSVRMVINEVYPGSRYDDTCLAEIEVWGWAN
jgi:hypothetical protein